MANRESTLSVILEDGVSKPARSVEEALKQAEQQIRTTAEQMSESAGASDKFVSSLARLGLSAEDVHQVAAAFKDFTVAQGLAGTESSEWTKDQIASVRSWESTTLSALRSVAAERKAETASMKAQFA